MCGIFCIINNRVTKQDEIHKISKHCKEAISRRGPDHFKEQSFVLYNNVQSTLMSSVRWTQGSSLTPQPVEDTNGNILQWNGDVYNGLNAENFNAENLDLSDTKKVLDSFSAHGVLKTLHNIEGPYAFIYIDRKDKKVWFGKDPIGRHSLLYKLDHSSLVVTSVANKFVSKLEEIPNTHIFSIDYTKEDLTSGFRQYLWKRSLPIHPALKHYHPKSPSTDIPPSEDMKVLIAKVAKDYCDTKNRTNVMDELVESPLFNQNIESVIKLLRHSIQKRVQTQPKQCIICDQPCQHCKTGILFSGGIDSTVIALLADEFITPNESIDLLNVAFEKNGNYDVPDRITGINSLEELKRLCPNRQWNFVKINITRLELEERRTSLIKDIIYPLDTVLDDSLGCAIWFAARGAGLLDNVNYVSTARVLLLGMGADELLGGYARHRNILRNCRNDWSALRAQLEHEVLNISKRNLGRDNRVVSDHGRQPRTPFLDEYVVGFLLSLSSWQRCWITDDLPASIGDKLLLRLAAWHLGLLKASALPKRALQFGSRIANSREKGDAVCDRL